MNLASVTQKLRNLGFTGGKLGKDDFDSARALAAYSLIDKDGNVVLDADNLAATLANLVACTPPKQLAMVADLLLSDPVAPETQAKASALMSKEPVDPATPPWLDDTLGKQLRDVLDFAQLRSSVSSQFGIRLQSTGSAADDEITRVILETIGASPTNPYVVNFDQIIIDSFTGTDVAATGVLTSDNTNVANNDTVTIGTKLYTFKTTLTPIEGEVLRGASADASLLNLIRAINHTGTPNTDYKCAAAHPAVTAASSVTAHAFQVTAIAPGVSTVATTETSAHLSWGAVTLVGGSRAGQFDLVERDSRRRSVGGASAGGTPILTDPSGVMNFQTGDEGKLIRIGTNPGRVYKILSRQSPTQVTLSDNITLPSAGLTLTMNGETSATIATKSGFADGITTGSWSNFVKVLTVDKVYSVVFVPGTVGDGVYSLSVRGLNKGA